MKCNQLTKKRIKKTLQTNLRNINPHNKLIIVIINIL